MTRFKFQIETENGVTGLTAPYDQREVVHPRDLNLRQSGSLLLILLSSSLDPCSTSVTHKTIENYEKTTDCR